MNQSKIVNAILVGATLLLTKYIAGVSKIVQQRHSKKQRKEAIQTWEGEGGTVSSTRHS